MKTGRFMDLLKNKKVLFGIITSLIVVVCISLNYYTRDAYASRVYYANSSEVSERLQNGDVIEQEFTLAEEDEGVQVFFATYVTVLDHGTIKGELFDPYGALIGEQVVDLKGTQDNTYTSFYFGKLDESLYNQKCKIRLTFDGIDDQLLSYYTAWTDGVTFCTVNGEPQNHNLVVNGIKATRYLEYRDFRLNYVMVIGIIMAYLAIFKIKWKEIDVRKSVEKAIAYVKMNWKLALKPAGLVAGGVIVSALAEMYISREAEYANPYRAFGIFAMLFIVAMLLVYRKYIWKRAHIFFFIVSMLVGSSYVLSAPPTSIGWDEPIHYTRTAYMAMGATNKILVPDYLILSRYTQQHYYDIFLKSQREAWVVDANEFDRVGGVMGYLEGVSTSSVSYVPTSILLYVTRVLGIDFITRYTMGKLFNVFMYSAFLALAIKLLQGRGKMIVAAVSLLPTNILMAGCYGYDWWLNSLIILGFAIFWSELQRKDVISTKKVAQSVGVMCLGLMAKAVYFPLLLPLMLFKKERYEDSKKARLIVLAGALFLVASFVLPMFVSSAAGAVGGGGDIRGGSDVNATGQISYILNNFGDFLNMLYNYLKSYLNPDEASGYLTLMAYQGKGDYYTICQMIMMAAAIVDNGEELVLGKKEPLAKCGAYVGVLGALILAIVALYVSYTAVGAGHVSGCQPRYILPVLAPFLLFFGENKMNIPEKTKGKLFGWLLAVMAYIVLRAIYYSFTIRY